MTLHPTYIEVEHELRYNRLREEAAINQQIQKVQQPILTIKTSIAQYLGDLLINLGYKLADYQATT